MNTTTKLTVALSVLILGGCGSDMIDLSCDKPRLYQQAVEGKSLTVPEDLDNLDPSKAMPIPDAAPPKPRPAGEPCLDIPPRYLEEEENLPTGSVEKK